MSFRKYKKKNKTTAWIKIVDKVHAQYRDPIQLSKVSKNMDITGEFLTLSILQ